jgi:lysophospholipase L1-like esterase
MGARIALIVAAILTGLVALEIGLRLLLPTGTLAHWPNYVLEARRVLAGTGQSRFLHDDLVGYRPRPGFSGASQNPGFSGVNQSYDARGLRRNGPGPVADSELAAMAPVLVTGDSYTNGEDVTDRETWPAHLEQLLGRPVLNGGVSGYGFDQSVLRAEALAAATKPAAIVVAFIADDINRTEMHRIWGAEKPYFDIESDQLVLRNVPVPPSPDPRTTLNIWQRTLGYSFLFDFILRRLDLLHNWFGDHVRVHPAGDGERIACLLTGRLKALQQQSGAPVLVMAQYDPVVWQDPAFEAEQRRLTRGLLACAKERGLAVLDSFGTLAASGDPRRLYGLWHMNDAGNLLTAEMVAAQLRGVLH